MLEGIYLWNTAEFGMLELADEYCSISSIMPQKKNPVALEMIRGEAVLVANRLNGMMGVLKAVPPGGGREWGYAKQLFPRCANTVVESMRTMAGIISTLTVNKEVMTQRALEGFSTATELTDEIVRRVDLSFRESHHIVGITTRMAITSGKMANEITSVMLDEAAMQAIGRPLEMDEQLVRKALDPVENVLIRDHIGGPAPAEVNRMIEVRIKILELEKRQLQDRKNRLSGAADALQNRVDEIRN
jgi:argininosuccinate lyase